MGLTSALNTSLNGLSLNETTIDVLGNNIANAGTNGFKASNVLFSTQLSRTLNVGSAPSADNGGTNPRQVGLGAISAAITRDFSQGSITTSTSPSDLAIQGEGFFIVDGADGTRYTRNGNFALNSANQLTNAQGLKLQGYGVDQDFQLVTTQLVDLEIPLGELNVAQQTSNVSIRGALFSSGTEATQGSILTSEALTDTSGGNPATDPIDGSTLLTSVFASGGTTALFTDGETLSFSPQKGGRQLDALTLDVTSTTDVDDLLQFMNDALGIQSGGTIPDDPTTSAQPTVEVLASGQIRIVGNQGTSNDIVLAVGDLTSDGSSVPISFTKSQSADGESTVTDFITFDSLGQPLTVKLTAVLESVTSTSTTFRWFIDSFDDSRTATGIANGTITYDSSGNISDGTTGTFSLERNDTAAVSPMQINIDFSNVAGLSTASAGSSISLLSQDGSAPGTLSSFVLDESGIINGIFDNGIVRTLGQITLARFSNSQGLLEAGEGTFQEGVSSGAPFTTTPGNFGTGTIRAGAIELSNTDIGRNLVDLIVASTNYRGNARVISSVQQLVDELLLLGR